MEKGGGLRPVHRRHHGWPGDSRELWSHVGEDVETMSPKARAVTGVVTGGAILLAAALLVLFTDLWWLILIFCWIVFLALETFTKGVAGLMVVASGGATSAKQQGAGASRGSARPGRTHPRAGGGGDLTLGEGGRRDAQRAG